MLGSIGFHWDTWSQRESRPKKVDTQDDASKSRIQMPMDFGLSLNILTAGCSHILFLKNQCKVRKFIILLLFLLYTVHRKIRGLD